MFIFLGDLMKKSVIDIKDLTVAYDEKPVLWDIDVAIPEGVLLSIVGPNGAGKTTTFYMIMGLIDCDGGEILLDDIHLTSLPMYKRAKLGIGFLPQQPSIFRGMSVEDNLLSILETQNLPKDQKQNMLEELLTEFSLTHLRRAMPHMLSGGERRRTEIARALALKPQFILLDEPFAGIDPIAVSDLKQTINQLNRKDIGILISDHNVRDTMNICSKVLVVNQGKIIADGEPSKIAQDSLVKEVYLGQDFQTN